MGKLNKSKGVCYICGEPATSGEHVPAKCFFPSDSAYRKQLIKVRSCKNHNENTSLDDEYVRNVICCTYAGNEIAFQQFVKKVLKSFLINPRMIIPEGEIQTPRGKAGVFQINRDRFDKVMRKIAYALYHEEYKKPWNRELMISTDQLVYSDFTPDETGKLLNYIAGKSIELSQKGKNPKVFKYSVFKAGETDEESIIRMIFYEGFTVWASNIIGSTKNKI